MQNESLIGKTALVTGSRRGIGQAIALAIAGAGADVVVCDLVTEDSRLDPVVEEIRKIGRRSMAVRADVSRKEDVEIMVRTAAKMGRIDILVNCAGIWIPGQTLLECTEENWDRVMDTNLKSMYLCCQAAGKIMVQQKSGNIINLSSRVGLDPGIGVGAYSISKAGIIMLTRQLSLELAPYHIRVNAIAPGIVKTDFNLDFWKNPDTGRAAEASVPLGRLAEPEDIADAVVFLASDAARYITGEVLNISGGWQPPVIPENLR